MWRLAAGPRCSDFRSAPSSGKPETQFVPNPQKTLRKQHLDRLVQWMVQDASLGRRDR
jgi:hypothetical protein